MQELSETLQGLKVAQELHQQFEEHLRQQRALHGTENEGSINNVQNKSTLPDPVWSAPSKTLENKIRRVFRLIGTDDAMHPEGDQIATLVRDVQSGRANRRDIQNILSKRSYDEERKSRTDETMEKNRETRSYHLRRVRSQINNGIDERNNDDEPFKMLELIRTGESALTNQSPNVSSIGARAVASGGIKLPVVYSAKKLKEEREALVMEATLGADSVTSYYILDEDAVPSQLDNFQAIKYEYSVFSIP